LARARLQINFENATLDELEVAMNCAPTKKGFVRFQVFFWLYQGWSQDKALQLSRVSQRQFRRWIAAFNARGIDGLAIKPKPGRARRISDEIFKDHLAPKIQDPVPIGHTPYTAVRLWGFLRDELKIEVGYSTVLRNLHEKGYALKVPRSWPEKQDQLKRAAFCKELKGWAQDPSIRLWFMDETGIEGDPRPRRRWAQKSDRIKTPYHGLHIRHNVMGAVCPETGETQMLVFDYCDTEVMQVFLDHLNTELPREEGKQHYLILDNVSWHKTKRLNWGRITPKYLPAYSPDLNPIERLWLQLKNSWFNHFIARNPEELFERIACGLKSFYAAPEQVKSICAIKTELKE
jgi:transposase